MLKHNKKIGILDNLFATKTFDERILKNGRWIDQKCTPDVLEINADCILNFAESNPPFFSIDDLTNDEKLKKQADKFIRADSKTNESVSFSVKDIWLSDYTVSNVAKTFVKPNPSDTAAISEYNKFFGQPLKLFAYAGILDETHVGGANYYIIKNRDALEYISRGTRSAKDFIIQYIVKVINDSGLSQPFEHFFEHQDADSLKYLKDCYTDFLHKNSNIKADYEVGRIFTKILNPLAYEYNSKGTKNGRISSDVISLDMLLYNRPNFRDIATGKPKAATRNVFEPTFYAGNSAQREFYSGKSKRKLKDFNDKFRDGKSEMSGDEKYASQAHHIFPESKFNEICANFENLIMLTPNQHYLKAHPKNVTSHIDIKYQYECVIQKIRNIEEDIKNRGSDSLYDFEQLLEVLAVGFSDNNFKDIMHGDYTAVRKLVSNYDPS
jgi:hypothetical protein